MKLYVIRHGQTNWNLEHRIQGHSDIPLNKTGIQQAQILAKNFQNIDADFILSSPLQRAFHTANIVNQFKNLEIQIEPRLIERNFGDFEGFDDLSSFDCDIDKLLDYHLNYHLYQVEPIQSLFNRISLLLSDLKIKYPYKKIILSTHGGVAQVIESILNNLPKETNLQSIRFNNCEYRVYHIHS